MKQSYETGLFPHHILLVCKNPDFHTEAFEVPLPLHDFYIPARHPVFLAAD